MSHKNKEGCAALHCRASSKGSLQHLWEQKHSSVSLKGAQKPRCSSGAARGASACPDLKTIGVHASCELEPGWTSPWPAWGAGSQRGAAQPRLQLQGWCQALQRDRACSPWPSFTPSQEPGVFMCPAATSLCRDCPPGLCECRSEPSALQTGAAARLP